jgi:hypothetical protein
MTESLEALTAFSKEQLAAIEEFFRASTVPLVREEGDKLALRGTGTFVQFEGELWLVTASHVIRNQEDLRELAVPMRSSRAFITLGNCTLYRPDNLELDVAIILIQDGDFKQQVFENWRVLDDRNITRFDQNVSKFVVAGYPCETLTKKGMNWRESFTQIHAGPYLGGANDAHHSILRLAYGRRAPDRTGTESETPHLGGLSGASVWMVVNESGGLWTPEKVLKVVAVQVSFKHGEYIGCEWWTLVRQVFRRWSVEYTGR